MLSVSANIHQCFVIACHVLNIWHRSTPFVYTVTCKLLTSLVSICALIYISLIRKILCIETLDLLHIVTVTDFIFAKSHSLLTLNHNDSFSTKSTNLNLMCNYQEIYITLESKLLVLNMSHTCIAAVIFIYTWILQTF